MVVSSLLIAIAIVLPDTFLCGSALRMDNFRVDCALGIRDQDDADKHSVVVGYSASAIPVRDAGKTAPCIVITAEVVMAAQFQRTRLTALAATSAPT